MPYVRKSSAVVSKYLEDLKHSGLSLYAFCKRENLNPKAVYAWRTRRAKQPQLAPMIPVRINVEVEKTRYEVKLVLRSGHYFEFSKGTDFAFIASLAGALS